MGFKSDDKCLAKVGDDEPIFVLRAQDKLAPLIVELWANLAYLHGLPMAKVEEAQALAHLMRRWSQTEQLKGRPGSKFPD